METTNTSQELWRTEFDKQYTREEIRALSKHTRQLMRFYRGYGVRSTDTAEDRLNSAIRKLFDGSRVWQPANVDLHGFLIGIVTSDLSTEAQRYKRAPMVSFETAPAREDDYTGETIEPRSYTASPESGSCGGSAEPVEAAWELALSYVRAMAGTKKKYADVLTLLDAYEDGMLTKRDVMTHLGWTAYRYRVVYARVIELANNLDPDARAAIHDAFTN